MQKQLAAKIGPQAAQGVASHFYQAGLVAARKHIESGVQDNTIIDPGLVASAIDLFYFEAFRRGELEQLIAHYAQATPPAPGTPGHSTAPRRGKDLPLPPNGQSGTNGATVLTKEQRRLVKAGISEDDVKKYSSPDFTFDD
jgi:hypothetical protein